MADAMNDVRWLVVTVEAPSDTSRDALVEGLLSLGGSSVQESAHALVTYIAAPDDVEAWLSRAVEHLHALTGAEQKIAWRWQENEDWSESWKRGLKARRVGRHFVVTPSWIVPELRAGDRVIVIDPEMAFGTGEHGTTRGALRFLEQVTKRGDRVLDIGTGSAILAIAAAQLGAGEVIALDNDADAILNARDNVQRNHVADAVQLDVRFVDAAYLNEVGAERFDIIVANVLSGVLKPLLSAFFNAVVVKGYVILGGILREESNEMVQAAHAAGFTVLGEDLEDEWWGVLLQRAVS